MISSSTDHAAVDAQLRDEALRAWVAENGPGLPLYLTKFIDQRLVDVEARIRDDIARYSLPERALRVLKAKFGK